MVFEKIANGLTKHYKLVVVIWIVALLISVPAILQVNSAVNYQTSFGSGDGYESTQANEIIAKNFQTSVANGTLIVLLQSDNVTDVAARDFILGLQDSIQSSSEMKYLEGPSSIYTYYSTMVLDPAILKLGPAMRPTEQNMSVGSYLLWGVPAMHAANWTESHSDSEAYNATSATLSAYLSQIHADANTTALAFGYYNAFAGAWNVTAIADPAARATTCVNAVAPSVINALPADQAQTKALLTAALNGFDLTNFSDAARAHALALNLVGGMASITNATFLQGVYDLGPTYEPSAVSAYADSIVRNGTLATYPIAIPEQLLTNFVSSNYKTMLFMVTFSVAADYVETNGDKPLMDNVNVLRNEINDLKANMGTTITTYVTGDAAISADNEASSSSDMAMIEPFTIIIILVLMGILFRSVLGQFLPLGAVGVAVGLSQAMVFIIGSTIAQIDYTVLTMMFAILMGVGTDYSIFIVTRYREERIRGATREQAVHVAVTWAGESIVTSGATVIVAFFAMATSSFAFVQTMGIVMGLSIIIALLVALTLVPAILMLVGNRMFWPTSGKRFERYAKNLMQRKSEGHHGYFHKAASFSVKHAKVVILAVVLVSIPTSYMFVTQETSFDFIGSMGNPESIQGMNAMTSDFGAGKIMPTQVVITGDTVVYDGTQFNYAYLDAIDNITATIAADSMIQTVTGITRPYGQWVDYRNLSALPAETRSQIETGMLTSMGNDSKSVLLTVVLKDQPQKASAVAYMTTLRSELADAKLLQPALATSTILVGGSTAMLHDMSLSTSQQFANIEILVVIGIFAVLLVVLGSVLLSAFAVVSIAVSITWSFAATTLVFGDWLGKPILWLIPLILFVMLMGIGMDYNVFILTRIREEVHKGKDAKTAVVDAVDWTGGIITALALIMAGAFGSIMLSSNSMLQEFGFALFLAVILDAMIVRTYVVPAAVVLMGKWAWWAPGRLQRVGRAEKMEKSSRQKMEKNGRQKTE
jgi:putative drug exporter of the RND superfamily